MSSSFLSVGGNAPIIRKSSLKPPSFEKPRKSNSNVKRKRRARQKTVTEEGGSEAWRERGKLVRARLIMKDEQSGGDAFTLSDDCEIEKYYDVAERVRGFVAIVLVLRTSQRI